jgi:hypothetical protein
MPTWPLCPVPREYAGIHAQGDLLLARGQGQTPVCHRIGPVLLCGARRVCGSDVRMFDV